MSTDKNVRKWIDLQTVLIFETRLSSRFSRLSIVFKHEDKSDLTNILLIISKIVNIVLNLKNTPLNLVNLIINTIICSIILLTWQGLPFSQQSELQSFWVTQMMQIHILGNWNGLKLVWCRKLHTQKKWAFLPRRREKLRTAWKNTSAFKIFTYHMHLNGKPFCNSGFCWYSYVKNISPNFSWLWCTFFYWSIMYLLSRAFLKLYFYIRDSNIFFFEKQKLSFTTYWGSCYWSSTSLMGRLLIHNLTYLLAFSKILSFHTSFPFEGQMWGGVLLLNEPSAISVLNISHMTLDRLVFRFYITTIWL